MPALRDKVGQTASIGQVEEQGIRILDIYKHRSHFEITTPPGTLFDFHSSAQGKVALAFGPSRLWDKIEAGKLKQWTPKTGLDVHKLKTEIGRIRRRGWAVAPEQAMIGINALAAPVFDAGGDLAGTIAIVGSIQHLTAKPEAKLVSAVREAAGEISGGLGFREAATG